MPDEDNNTKADEGTLPDTPLHAGKEKDRQDEVIGEPTGKGDQGTAEPGIEPPEKH